MAAKPINPLPLHRVPVVFYEASNFALAADPSGGECPRDYRIYPAWLCLTKVQIADPIYRG